MNLQSEKSAAVRGHTLLELLIVMVLVAILAGISYFGIFRSIELYTKTTRDHIDLVGETTIALEKISREIRETTPCNVTLGNESITLMKRSGHATEEDGSLGVSFSKSGLTVQRISSAGTFDLVDNVTGFEPSWDEQTRAVIIDLTLARGENVVRLRTAAAPRQKPSPAPAD
jgi:prepilin-type N-terminal cleavage/methylation domain-containing protein